MTQYYFKQINRNWIAIAKFTDSSEPDDTYDVISGKCNCPAGWRGPCKHLRYVKAWKEAATGAPPNAVLMYDDETDKFITPEWYDTQVIDNLLKGMGYEPK